MNRKHFLRSSAGLALGTLLFGDRALAQISPAWEIKMLTPDLGIFTEMGGTIAFHLSSNEITVVDAQFPSSVKHLIAELKKKNLPINLLINTHHHSDHTAGNIAFKGLTEKVLAHKNSLYNQEVTAKAQHKEDEQYYPNETYTKRTERNTGKETIQLYYFGAGHTNGDSYVHFEKNNIVHVGDLVFNRRHPYVDRSAGASMKSWIQVLDKGLQQFDAKTTFVCGHSGEGWPVTGKRDMLSSFQDYLGHVLQFVEKEIKAGKTREEILKTTSIPGAPEWQGDGIQRPLTAAYEELSEG